MKCACTFNLKLNDISICSIKRQLQNNIDNFIETDFEIKLNFYKFKKITENQLFLLTFQGVTYILLVRFKIYKSYKKFHGYFQFHGSKIKNNFLRYNLIHEAPKMSSKVVALIVHIIIMLFAGTFGGIINYYLDQENREKNKETTKANYRKSIIIGIGAALLVPLFLTMISSDLADLGVLNPKTIMVFFGFCLIAAISSKKFIATLSEQVLKEVKEAKERAKETEEKLKQSESQGNIDARVLNLLDKVLIKEPDKEEFPKALEELKEKLKKASKNVRVTAFIKARAFRVENQMTESIANSVIPVFEVLIECDKEDVYHRNHAQLGYTLKDKPNPDYERAEKELTKAIEVRDRVGEKGYFIYEFNRALVKIETDPNLKLDKPSAKPVAEMVAKDLKSAAENPYWQNIIKGKEEKDRNKNLLKWTKLNSYK